MDKQNAINYLRSSGYGNEQIRAIASAFGTELTDEDLEKEVVIVYEVYVEFKNDPDPDWFSYSGCEHENKDDAINEAAEALMDPAISNVKIKEKYYG